MKASITIAVTYLFCCVLLLFIYSNILNVVLLFRFFRFSLCVQCVRKKSEISKHFAVTATELH